MIRSSSSRLVAVALVSLGFSSCSRSGPAWDEAAAVWDQFDGQKAFDHVADIVALGPRPPGSASLEESRVLIETHLSALGWQVQRQAFRRQTPIGEVEFVNLRARFAESDSEKLWNRSVRVLLCSHYDTKLYRELPFVGANDPGSSMGALLEAARVLSLRPELAAEIELAFFDGEEAFGPSITASDGLYGSTYYAGDMLTRKPEQRPKRGLLLDMVGDVDPRFPVEGYSSQLADEVVQRVWGVAHALGYEETFPMQVGQRISDDHLPLNNAGLPTANIIDFDYGPDNAYWHTQEDVLDKLSAGTLESVAEVVLELIYGGG